MLPTQACTSHTGPQGCFVHHWNVCVEHCLQLHPICTMCTVPNHKVPTYAHWLNSLLPMVGAPFCAHHTSSHQFFTIFLHPGTAMHVLNLVTSLHFDTVTHLITHSLDRLCFNPS